MRVFHNKPLQSRPLKAKTQLFNVAVLLSFICFGSYSAHAVVPAGFEETVITSGLQSPTAMAFAPDGRLFVCEQIGRLRIIQNGTLLPSPFADFSPVLMGEGEAGLLGVAFDPAFTSNRYIYLYYTRDGVPNGARRNHLVRVRASASNPNLMEAGSEVLLLNIGVPVSGAHNGGVIHFGRDGMLYVGVGEHGDTTLSQNLNSLGGKLLRLNVANYPGSMIPSDNPFVGQSGARGEIYSYGLRNPFTFNVDPVNGRIYINDVGGNQEEINQAVSGANFGWPTCQGGPCGNSAYTDPVFSYPKGGLGGCAITGGTFYRGTQFPAEYNGHYFFSDFCGNFIRRLDSNNTQTLWGSDFDAPVDLQVGPDGMLYSLERVDPYQTPNFLAEVTRIRYVGSGVNSPPTAQAGATPANGPAPLTVTFSGAGSSDPNGDTLTYSWNFGDASTGTGLSVSHTYTSSGTYTTTLTVSDGRGGTDTDTETITVGNGTPTGVIATPPATLFYRGGDTLSYSGTASDPEDGTLPASAFSWLVAFHHDTHSHPFLGPITGVRSGTFQIPQVGETSTNVWYRIRLTTTDSGGLTHVATRDVFPSTMTFTLQTVPPGLQALVDGGPVTTPQPTGSVVGMQRGIGVTSPQTLGGRSYEFASWSDAGAQNHTITMPSANMTYTATFREITPSNRCDVNNSGATDIVDVQQAVNQAIGFTPCSTADINLDTQCNVIDVQRVVNAILGGTCVTP